MFFPWIQGPGDRMDRTVKTPALDPNQSAAGSLLLPTLGYDVAALLPSGDEEPRIVDGVGEPSAADLQMPLYIFVTVTIFSILIFLLGVGGNGMVLFIILKNKDMRSATNMCLFSLSVADLLILLICMPSALLEFYGKDVWYLGPTMCKLVPFLENTAVHASASTILAISIERYVAICLPLKVRQIFTYAGTAKVVASVWVIAAALTIPYTIITFTEEAIFFDGSLVQVCRTHAHSPWQRGYIIMNVCVFFLVPLLIIVVLYGFIGWRLSEQSQDPRLARSSKVSLSFRMRRQIVLMLIIVAVMFFVCLLPFKVVGIWFIYAQPRDIERLGLEGYLNLLSFARTMYYINSAVNPVVYNLVSTKFRNYFKRSFICCQRGEDAAGKSFNLRFSSSKRSFTSNGGTIICDTVNLDEVSLNGTRDYV